MPLAQSRARFRILLLVVLVVSSCCLAKTPGDPYAAKLADLVSRFGSSSQPEKAVLLDQIANLRDYVNDSGTVLKALNGILGGRDEATLVRDEAKWQRARIALHERRLGDVGFAIDTLGFVRDWTLSSARDCKGKNLARGTTLRTSPLGVVSVYESPATVCAVTAVYSNSAQDVALRFSANVAVSTYVNGVILKSATSSKLAFDQFAAGVRLQPGWNTVAVHLAGKESAKQFSVRITGVDGGGFAWPADSSRATANVRPLIRVSVSDLLSMAELQASKTPTVVALDTLGALENLRARSTAFATLEKAAKLGPTAQRWVEVAQACPDQTCIAAALNRAVQLDAQNVNVKLALADYYIAIRQPYQAASLLREVADRNPDDFVARKRLADALAESGNGTMAADEFRKLEAIRSNSIWLRRELGLRYEAAGESGRANAILNQVWKANFDDDRVRSALQRLAQQRDDQVALEMLAQAANIANPADPVAQREIVQYAPALRDFTHAGDTAPATSTPSEVGSLKYEPLRGSLVRASNRIDDRTDRRPNDNDSAYFADAAKLAADVQRNTPTESANIIVLSDITVERMRENGQSTVHAQQVFYVANDRGARDYATRSVQFASANQKLAMVSGRIYKPDGRVVEAIDQGESTVTDNSNTMYFDTRSHALRFGGLEKGDVLELEYRIVPNSDRNPYGNYFGALVTFQTGLPQRLRRYVLVAPGGRKLNIDEERMPAKAEVVQDAGETIYKWDARNLKPLISEPRGPSHTEIAPYVSISTFEDWDELGRWYASIISPQMTLDGDLRTQLEKIAASAKTDEQKIQAVYEFVLRNTNYVAMEFGIYSYKPYPVTQVYARRFGDCKDKASLMIAMLRALNIDAELALVRTRKLGDVSDRATTLAVFNHALAYVPKYKMWLDGTAEFAGSRELPLDDQGALALTVNLDGSANLRRVPVTLPMQNYTHRLVQAKVHSDGRIVFDGTAYTRGEDAPGLRREYELADRQKDTLRGNLAQVYPSVKIENVHVDGAHDIERDVNVKFSGSIDTFAGQKTLTLAPSWLPHKYVNSLAPLESRTQDLQLPAPWTTEEEIHFTLPEGAKIHQLPENLRYETPFGTAMIRYERHANDLSISTSVQFSKLRIAPSEYSAFREFCSNVENAFHRDIKVRLGN